MIATGTAQQWNQGGSPVLAEDQHHQRDQDDRVAERLVNSFTDSR